MAPGDAATTEISALHAMDLVEGQGWMNAQDKQLAASTAEIRHKLETTIIPKMEFRDATLREAIDFLNKKSVELDDSSGGKKGTNFVLKLESSGGGGGALPALAPAAPLPAIPGFEAAPPAAAPAGNGAETRITVSLTNIPLIEALKYVTGLAGLKFKIEPHAVAVVPMAESTDVYITKEWKIPLDLLPRTPEWGPESAKNWLIANGVTFNGPASAIYIVRSSRLIVRNTQDQLDLIDQVIGEAAQTGKAVPAKKAESAAPIPEPEIQTANAFSTFSLNVSESRSSWPRPAWKRATCPISPPCAARSSSTPSTTAIRSRRRASPRLCLGTGLRIPLPKTAICCASRQDGGAGRQAGRPLNLVLLLDNSGSMERADRVAIIREALRVLAANCNPRTS